MARHVGCAETTYSTGARHFHWWTVALLAIQVPVGLYMVYRGNTLNVWDGLTNALYSSHKTLGLVILALVVARLLTASCTARPPTSRRIEWWQKAASHATHWSLYLLLILVPLVGWLGISLYGARDVFGIATIPPLAAQNRDAADAGARAAQVSGVPDRRAGRDARRGRRGAALLHPRGRRAGAHAALGGRRD